MRFAQFLPLLPLAQAAFQTVQYQYPACGNVDYDVANGTQTPCANGVPCQGTSKTDCNVASIPNPTTGLYAILYGYGNTAECAGTSGNPVSELVWKSGICWNSLKYVCNGTHVVQYNCKSAPDVETGSYLYDRCDQAGVRGSCRTFDTPRPTPRPSEAPSKTGSPTVQITKEPTARPTDQGATKEPTARPTEQVTKEPTARPTDQGATKEPTARPTEQVTKEPTARPTDQGATKEPTARPTEQVTKEPTARPTQQGDTREPTVQTKEPTARPTQQGDTREPTPRDTPKPTPETKSPTTRPTKEGETRVPTEKPTRDGETRVPTEKPTKEAVVNDNSATSLIVGPSLLVLGWLLM